MPAPTEIQGLSQSEVLARRARGQGNDVQFQTSRSYFQIIRENVFSFINNVLFGLGIALALLGRYSDAFMSVGVVFVNTLVSVVQEVRAKRILDQIALLTRPKATVVREGREQTIDPAEIVLGDVLVLHSGDQVVVDGQMVGGRADVDESLLTGEADLVPKRAGDPVYSGSFCVAGQALYEAQKVGADSFAMQLTSGAQAFRRVHTPLQQEINLVIRIILLIAVYFELLLILRSLSNRLGIVESVRMSTVIIGLVPNALFLALALAYAMGAVRMVRQGALVQQANAVESLSNVDVLCMDKTGTITTNRLRLDDLQPIDWLETEVRRMLGDYVTSTTARNRTSDALCDACGGQARTVREEVLFSSQHKWSALALDDPALPGVYVLGAPEMLVSRLRPGRDLAPQIDEWAARGLRVLLFAHRPDVVPLSDAGGQPVLPDGLIPLAILSLSDELRPEARETFAGFGKAGIRFKIISGDSLQTVAALARQAGLGPELKVVSGAELAEMDRVQFAQAAEDTTVFGRVTPRQKENLVEALRRRGHYVAMIGDGVNDVLSLKKANLGISVQSGSQMTRSVADIILLNDSFASLPFAFREGQRILNGMQDILRLFLTRVLVVALLILSIQVAGSFPFTPKNASLLALLTVGIPTIALAAWAQSGPTRRNGLVRALLHFVLPAALTLSLVALGVYMVYYIPTFRAILLQGSPAATRAAAEGAVPVARSALTSITVLGGLILIPFAEPPIKFLVGGEHLSGDWRPTILAGALLVVYLIIMAVPSLRDFFELVKLPDYHYPLICLAAVAWAVILRWVWRTRLLDRFLGLDMHPSLHRNADRR
jgi:cation-transporting P-type ATPase E